MGNVSKVARKLMAEYNPQDYSFLGLCNRGKPLELVTSLAYLVGLVNSISNPISAPAKASRVIAWLFDEEEQVENAFDLLDSQSRALPGGILPTNSSYARQKLVSYRRYAREKH